MENGECSGQVSTEPIRTHDFSEKVLEQMVHFHVMKLTGGFFLWIGTSPVLSNLAVSMNSRFVSYMPVVPEKKNKKKQDAILVLFGLSTS